MFIFDTIKNCFHCLGLFGRPGTKELRHEKIRLERMEERVGEEIVRLARLQQVLFRRGVGEIAAARPSLARKIKDLNARVRAKHQNQALCREHIQILSRLLEFREREGLRCKLHAALPVGPWLRQGLAEWMGRATPWDSRERDPGMNPREGDASRLTRSHRRRRSMAPREGSEGPIEPCSGGETDKDLAAMVAAMEDARAAQEAGDPSGVAEALRRMQRILAAEASEAELC